MVSIDLYKNLPTSDELPDSDDTPVDNEDQNFLPNYLLFLLAIIWKDRNDWYFGVDMGIYHTSGDNPRVPVIPDGFLTVGVNRRRPGNKSRKSYVVWEEGGMVPQLVLEVVSWTPGNEYESKMAIYEKLGVLYYVIYNPEYYQRDRHQPFEIYRQIDGKYQLQTGEPYWLPEIGLGIGRSQATLGGIDREILSWFDQEGRRYLSSEELAQQAQLEAQQAQLEAQQAQLEAQKERQARLAAIAQLDNMGLTVQQISVALGLSVNEVRQQLEES
ncbi:Uma2 family endonuclease [Limnospira fusiformis KN01]|uniref:Uma2 family endonuclease n=1 Tax=Limnospira fusiformis TaxID=54297 RepID=UPI001658B350|nr:Uma2 family endonuclease [Limnospira fusiformis]ULB47845.1 Uma2 family endonuclease [Limnospira fusiformis KN01]